MRIEMEEIKKKKESEAYQLSQQSIKSLEESQQNLAKREEEYERKLKSSQAAKISLEKAQQETREKAELLAMQLKIFQQHGLSPQEKAFQKTLGQTKQLFRRHQLQPPRCFISYAWEDMNTPEGKSANERLQEWNRRLSKDLQKVGCKVFFDLENMQGNLKDAMRDNISQSNCFIVMCTPQWKERIEAGLTPTIKECIEKNLMEGLNSGLETLKTSEPNNNFVMSNNATFEFVHIWAKMRSQPHANTLILLHFSGTFDAAILPMVRGELIRKVTNHSDQEYYDVVINLSDPVGMICNMFGLKIDGREGCLNEYTALVKKLHAEIGEIKLKMENAELQIKIRSLLPP